jgi:hypothetical protein
MRNAPNLNSADNTAIRAEIGDGFGFCSPKNSLGHHPAFARLPERAGRSVRVPQLAASFIRPSKNFHLLSISIVNPLSLTRVD